MSDDIRIIKGFRVKRHPDGRLETLGPANEGPQPVTVGRVNPAAQYEAPKAQAQAANENVNAQVNAATAPAQVRTTNAQATVAENEAAASQVETTNFIEAQRAKDLRSVYRTDAVLNAIRNARQIARTEGGTGWESLLSSVPASTARKLQSELSPILGNLSFDRLQEMREESKTGGALGAVSERELDLLGSTVASLDPGVDTQTFLRRLDAIERHFISAQLAAGGIDPKSEAGRAAFKNDFGYTGVFDDEMPEGPSARLGADNATETRYEIPEEYQREHLRYLRDNWGRIDPQDYVRFRSSLDNAFGLTPDLQGYAAAAPTFNDAAREGAAPEQLGVVPDAAREMGAIERGINYLAQSAPGAAFANATNSFAAGIPARLGGEQEKLELLREARPVSSFVGEMVGAGAGTLALGGGAAQIGGRAGAMLSNPFASEIVHSAVSGATQDDNALRGAGMGVLGSVAGSAAGRQIGKAFPDTFAGGAVRQADESVPTVEQLKERAGELYAEVEARGVAAGPEQTTEMFDRANRVLASNGRAGPGGQAILQDGPTRQAYDLLQSYAGVDMTPTQAQTVRETLGEGLMSSVPKERRIAAQMLSEFDDWAQPVMPGAEQAREVSSRYIRGQQLGNLTDRAVGRGRRLRGSDDAAQVRTLYGQLDERIQQGQAAFDDLTAKQITRVAEGDPLTNGLRWVGKFSPQNVLPALGQGGTAVASAVTGNPLPAMIAGAGAGAGLFGRSASNARTLRAAQEAELTALGGQDYLDLLKKAEEVAAARAGRAIGGASGAAASAYTRPEWQYQPPVR